MRGPDKKPRKRDRYRAAALRQFETKGHPALKHGISQRGGNHYSRFKRYGLTPEQFEAMWRKQQGKCALCAKTLGIGAGKHAIDHDHDTGIVRALLCLRCNVGLGWFESFKALAETYLERHCPVRNCD